MSDHPSMRISRPNFRHHRAMALNCEIMRIVGEFLQSRQHYENDDERNCSRKILEMLMRDGVEVLTDADRASAGLEPRGPDGWTVSEIQAYEMRRLEAMLAPWATITTTDSSARRTKLTSGWLGGGK